MNRATANALANLETGRSQGAQNPGSAGNRHVENRGKGGGNDGGKKDRHVVITLDLSDEKPDQGKPVPLQSKGRRPHPP
eukprot:12613856-Heterocapsa_arctica.AAC.1